VVDLFSLHNLPIVGNVGCETIVRIASLQVLSVPWLVLLPVLHVEVLGTMLHLAGNVFSAP
jgi:hypothetical protein